MDKKIKILNPKLDVVFQALFGEQGSERITKAFLEKILGIEIQEIELNQNPILRRDKINDKLGVLDVIAKINNNQNVDIEMQMSKKDNIRDRIMYYWSKLFIRSIKKNQDYLSLEKSIVILITDEKIKNLEELECHTEWKILEMKNKTKILTDKFEIHIIELEKLRDNEENISLELLDWLMFLQNPESERVKKSMESNREIREAKEKLEKISEDEQMQQLAWWREKGIYEENERKRQEEFILAEQEELKKKQEELNRKKEELKNGQEDLKNGQEELKNGQEELKNSQEELKNGQEELKNSLEELDKQKKEFKEKQKEIAKKLLNSGMSLDQIADITEIPKEEITKL